MKLLLTGLTFLMVTTVRAQNTHEAAQEEFSCGRLYYRTVYLDEVNDALYVGAMDRIMRLEARNISMSDCEANTLHMEANNVANCVSKGKSRDYDCRNHIRVIQPMGADHSRLYVCGTNGHNPKDRVIYANLTKLARHEFYPGIGDGIAKCPFDPEDNSTALWVENGNPGEHPAIYSGTNAEFTKADTVIFRGDIFDPDTGRREYTFKRTLKYDSHMLDKPDFVGSYDVGEYVYFFFREMAVEYMNCGKTIYSRVARVCKRDTGGKNILHQNWATYLKARLNCSIPGDFPFFFNEIQDVFKAENDDSIFHAVFTTNSNGLIGSAICSFKLEDLERVFDGKFKEQTTSASMWLPVPSAKVPTPRPGSCVPDTRELPDTVLNFIRKHPLMDGDVAHDANGPPVFYVRDVTFTKIAVDDRVGSHFTVYYAGTKDGKVYKVSRWRIDGKRYQSKLLDVFDAGTNSEPVRALALSKRRHSLYVTSDSVMVQFRLMDMCSTRYKNCVPCTADPYCGWNSEKNTCEASTASTSHRLLQDPMGQSERVCDSTSAQLRQKLTTHFGSSLHLECNAGPSLLTTLSAGEDDKLTWYHYDNASGKRRHISVYLAPGGDSNAKHVLTQDNGLVIIGMSSRDSGRYDCRLGRKTVASYNVVVDLARCAAPNKTTDYQRIYSAWCNEFQKYKASLKTWELRRSQCPNTIAGNFLDVTAIKQKHATLYGPQE